MPIIVNVDFPPECVVGTTVKGKITLHNILDVKATIICQVTFETADGKHLYTGLSTRHNIEPGQDVDFNFPADFTNPNQAKMPDAELVVKIDGIVATPDFSQTQSESTSITIKPIAWYQVKIAGIPLIAILLVGVAALGTAVVFYRRRSVG